MLSFHLGTFHWQWDIEEIKADYLKGLQFHYVTDMSQVIDLAITDKKVKGAKKL